MAVVCHQTGSPSNRTMAQKETITRLRIRKLWGLSGGGSFFVRAALTASGGAASSWGMPVPGGALIEALMASARDGSAIEPQHGEDEAGEETAILQGAPEV